MTKQARYVLLVGLVDAGEEARSLEVLLGQVRAARCVKRAVVRGGRARPRAAGAVGLGVTPAAAGRRVSGRVVVNAETITTHIYIKMCLFYTVNNYTVHKNS